MTKTRALKSYEKLDISLKKALKVEYPKSFRRYMKSIIDHKGKKIKVLPYETDDTYYLIKFPDNYFFIPAGEEYDTENKEVMDLDEDTQEQLNKETELDVEAANK